VCGVWCVVLSIGGCLLFDGRFNHQKDITTQKCVALTYSVRCKGVSGVVCVFCDSVRDVWCV
jgi:hypothetical protein